MMPRCTSENGRHKWGRVDGGGLRDRKCETCGAIGVRWSSGAVYPPDFKRDQPAKNYTSRRTRGIARAVTLSTKVLTRRSSEDLVDDPTRDRPQTRGDCVDGPRPCPFVGCKYNLYLDINAETGSIKINFPTREPWEMQSSCALDVADTGEHTLEEIGLLMNLTRERTRQIEARVLLGRVLADFRKKVA